jgi:tryptophan synthase alpha chain
MSRIQTTFNRLNAQGKKALIPFVTAGYPAIATTVALMHKMVAAGSDIIELGVPFSDPSADGPVIQAAGDVALANGVGLVQVLALVAEFRQTDSTTPVVLMGYANPIERYNQKRQNLDGASGAGRFVQDAAAAGVDGILVVDYPPEECEAFATELKAAGLDLIFLLAPTSTPERMAQIGRLATGYVYYVSLKGVTGSGALDVASVAEAIPRIRQYVSTPVGVGFGIRDAESAKAVGAVSDGVVIGSKIIQLLGDEDGVNAVAAFLTEIRAALDAS